MFVFTGTKALYSTDTVTKQKRAVICHIHQRMKPFDCSHSFRSRLSSSSSAASAAANYAPVWPTQKFINSHRSSRKCLTTSAYLNTARPSSFFVKSTVHTTQNTKFTLPQLEITNTDAQIKPTVLHLNRSIICFTKSVRHKTQSITAADKKQALETVDT